MPAMRSIPVRSAIWDCSFCCPDEKLTLVLAIDYACGVGGGQWESQGIYPVRNHGCTTGVSSHEFNAHGVYVFYISAS